MDLLTALYIVPTPIGNMQDITARAVNVLCGADVICAEDTRHSLPLLENIGVKSPTLISFHDHNEAQKAEKIAELINEGKSVALISDAGTPLISDPGYHLVTECVSRNIKVIPLPGPCAAITALCASGMPTDRFSFEGFLPVKAKALKDKLNSVVEDERTLIFYEAPRRMMDTAIVLGEVFGDRDVAIGRELTKTFEIFYYAKACDIAKVLADDPNADKGEMVLIVAPFKKDKQDCEIPKDAIKLLKILLTDMPVKKCCAVVSQMYDLKKNDLYSLALELNDSIASKI